MSKNMREYVYYNMNSDQVHATTLHAVHYNPGLQCMQYGMYNTQDKVKTKM